LGDNFSNSTNNIISVEAAKVYQTNTGFFWHYLTQSWSAAAAAALRAPWINSSNSIIKEFVVVVVVVGFLI
jgi:hypothetical protein